MAERLARETGAHNVDRFHLTPGVETDLRQVAEVRHTGPMMVEQLVAVLVDLRTPGKGRAVMMLDGHIQAPVPRTQ